MNYGKKICASLKLVRKQIADASNSNVAIHLNSKSPMLLFSHILLWHSIDVAEAKDWQPIDDKALHLFYTSTGLSALEFITSKADMLIELFQGLPQ